MSRPLRIHYQNAWYHVMSRGARRQKIFRNTSHRIMFLELLEEAHNLFNINICAYCLMDNHYHLLISTPDANLSRAMRHINGIYTQKYNRSLKTDGPLFKGRYKSKLIDDDCYQLIVSRYIHLNPVEAGLSVNPADYQWSSYAAYIGKVKTPYWLSSNMIIEQLSQTKALSHVQNYQDYVEDKNIEEINVFVSTKNTSPIIGSVKFKEAALSQINPLMVASCSADIKRARTLPKITTIIEHVCSYYHINYESLIYSKSGTLNLPKHVYMYICRIKFAYALRTIAESLSMKRPETVSSEIRKFLLRLDKNRNLFNEIDMIYDSIMKSIDMA
jgi:putative transposase